MAVSNGSTQNAPEEADNRESSCGRRRRVRLNIRGVVYEVERGSIDQHPKTLLSSLVRQGHQYYDPANREFFFDRDPYIFNCILNYYSTGHLHFRHCMCRHEVQKELEFWRIDETTLSPCCWVWFVQKASMEEKCKAVLQSPSRVEEGDNGPVIPKEEWKRKLYLLLDRPDTSRFAQVGAQLCVYTICHYNNVTYTRT